MINRHFTHILFLILIISQFSNILLAQNIEDPIGQFIRNNPDKVSFYFIKDDSINFGLNEDNLKPVASLSKTIIALEFAYQVLSGTINSEELVAVAELDRFVIGDDNFKNWQKQIKKDRLILKGKIPLKYVTQGMVRHSANACADYIINRLGIDNINRRIDILGINHEPIFPFTASLLVAFNYGDLERQSFLNLTQQWTREEYKAKVQSVHDKLTTENDFLVMVKKRLSSDRYRDLKYDEIWSNNFSLSSAKEYAQLIERINGGDFGHEMEPMLRFLFETWALEENVELKSSFDGLAYKGAGTNSMVNVWLYLRDKEGSTTQFVGLFNNLSKEEFKEIEINISNFGFKMCTESDFRQKWRNENR